MKRKRPTTCRASRETVHTFGWYLKKMIADVLAKNANPIVISMTVRGEWTDGKIERGYGDYAKLAGELARQQGVRYIDLTNIVADQYQEVGPEKVKAFFRRDTTHTNRAGADMNAQAVIAGIKALHEYALINAMTSDGRAVEVAAPNTPPLRSLPCRAVQLRKFSIAGSIFPKFPIRNFRQSSSSATPRFAMAAAMASIASGVGGTPLPFTSTRSRPILSTAPSAALLRQPS